MSAFYNEIEPFAARWLVNLIDADQISDGVVDERSIREVGAEDVEGASLMRKVATLRAVQRECLAKHGRPDAAVLNIIATWTPNPALYVGPDIVAGWWGGLTINFGGPLITLPVRAGEPEFRSAEGPLVNGAEMVSWGLDRLASGVWALSPSLQQSGLLHAFLTLVDVPDPAPWEVG